MHCVRHQAWSQQRPEGTIRCEWYQRKTPPSLTAIRVATASSAQYTQKHVRRRGEKERDVTQNAPSISVKHYNVLHIGQDQTKVLNDEGLEFSGSISRSWHPRQAFITFPLIHFLNTGLNCSSKSMWEQGCCRHLPGSLFKVSDTVYITGQAYKHLIQASCNDHLRQLAEEWHFLS